MGTFFKTLLAAIIVFQFLSGTAAAWEEGTATNQTRAYEYILQLKTSDDPGGIERPVLKRARTWQAKKARRQLIKAMNQAEQLADTGQRDRIELPPEIEKTSRPKSVSKY